MSDGWWLSSGSSCGEAVSARRWVSPQDQVSHYAAPARADSLAGLPPAYIATMQFDPMRDEGILYALRLLDAGVSVELHSSPGTFHGSHVIADAAVTQRETTEMMVVLRRALDLG